MVECKMSMNNCIVIVDNKAVYSDNYFNLNLYNYKEYVPYDV